jgi:hypothetical protein
MASDSSSLPDPNILGEDGKSHYFDDEYKFEPGKD